MVAAVSSISRPGFVWPLPECSIDQMTSSSDYLCTMTTRSGSGHMGFYPVTTDGVKPLRTSKGVHQTGAGQKSRRTLLLKNVISGRDINQN